MPKRIAAKKEATPKESRETVDHLRELYGPPLSEAHREAHAVFAIRKQDRFSLPLDELDRLPYLRQQQRIDSCSVSLYMPAFRDGSMACAARQVSNVSHVAAAFVRVRYSMQTAARIEAAIAAADLPLPPIIITTQWELVLLWVLRDKNDATRPPTMREGQHSTASRYRKIQRQLALMLAAITKQADVRAGAMTECIPLPGPRAEWKRSGNTYTLTSLWEAVHRRKEPKPRKRRKARDSAAPKSPDPDRQKRMRDLHTGRIRAIQALCRIRGSLTGEQPAQAARVIALAMKAHHRITRDERPVTDLRNAIHRQLERTNRYFRPPLTPDEVDRLLSDVLTRRAARTEWLDNRTISQWLDIAPDESSKLKRRGYNFQPATRFQELADLYAERVSKTDQRVSRRREAILRLHAQRGAWPSVREAVDALAQQGIQASVGSVHSDLKALKAAE